MSKNTVIECTPLYYKEGYKYVSTRDFTCYTGIVGYAAQIKGPNDLRPQVELRQDGLLIVRSGYASDGGSGPTIDTPNTMRATHGVHDPLYQLGRAGKLPECVRIHVDALMRDLMIQDDEAMMWRPDYVDGPAVKRWLVNGAKGAAYYSTKHARLAFYRARAWTWYFSVRKFAGYAWEKKGEREEICVP